MARGWLGVGILVLFLILGFVTAQVMDSTHLPTGELLEQAAEKTLNGEFDSGVTLAMAAKQRWAYRWNETAAVADHAPMEEVDSLFAEMEVYAKAGEQPHFAACCLQLAKMVRAVADAHRFSWWNLL